MKTTKHRNSRILLLCTLWVLVCSSGATCIRRNNVSEFAPPVLFNAPPTIQQLADVLNRSREIRELQSNTVSIRMEGVPALQHSSLFWQRPKSFRLRAGVTSFTGTDFDLGSNDQVFWMAVRQGVTPDLFYASHEQFDQQLQRQELPVSPLWLVEALGIIELDPYALAENPQMRADGLVEITTLVPLPAGTFVRTVVVDPKYGTVKQVMLRDPTRKLLASSQMSQHQYYSSVQYSLPHQVQIQLIPTGKPPLNMVIDIGHYMVNSTEGTDPTRYVMPDQRGYNAVDLIQLGRGSSYGAAPMAPAYPPQNASPPAVSYRGFEAPTLFR